MKNKLLEKEVTIIDHFVKFKENNKLEVKEAKGGLPNNIREKYSAFANSYKTSYNLILYLLELDLIEPVIGYGKGKYKFK